VMLQSFPSFSSVRSQKAPFPESELDIKELIFFRTWQAEGLIRVFYYFMLIIAIVQALSILITYSLIGGAGNVIAGLVYGVLSFFGVIISARLFCEALLSVCSIRDSVDALASASRAPTAAAEKQEESPIQSYQNSSFQGGAPPQTQQYDSL